MNFEWAWRRVREDWRTRQRKKRHNVLPPAFTSRALRYMQRTACRHEDPQHIECAAWTQTPPAGDERENPLGPFPTCREAASHESACAGCRHPYVPLHQLPPLNTPHCEKTWRRYLAGETPMPPEDFRQTVLHGLSRGWWSQWQTYSLLAEANELEAVTQAARKMSGRVKERKDYVEGQEVELSAVEVERETQRQHNKAESGATKTLNQLRQSPDRPKWVRQMATEVLFRARRDQDEPQKAKPPAEGWGF